MEVTVDQLQEAIRKIEGLKYELMTGNCGKFAISIQNLLGDGVLVGVFREPGRFYDHVFLEWNGWWWDGNGLQDPDAYIVPALGKEVGNLDDSELEYIQTTTPERALDRTSPTGIRIGFLEFLIAEKLGQVTYLKPYQDYEVSRVPLGDKDYRYRFLDDKREIEEYVLASNKDSAIKKL